MNKLKQIFSKLATRVNSKPDNEADNRGISNESNENMEVDQISLMLTLATVACSKSEARPAPDQLVQQLQQLCFEPKDIKKAGKDSTTWWENDWHPDIPKLNKYKMKCQPQPTSTNHFPRTLHLH